MFSIFSTKGGNIETDFPAKIICSGCSGVLPRFSLSGTGLALQATRHTVEGEKVLCSLQGLLWPPLLLSTSFRMPPLQCPTQGTSIPDQNWS